MRKFDGLILKHRYLLTAIATVPLIGVLALSTPVWAAPMLTVSPASGATGTMIMINGTVFDSYKGDNIYIFFDDEEIDGSPLIVDDSGNFAITFEVPEDTEPGRYWIEARTDTDEDTMVARSSFLVEEPMIRLDISEGAVGTEVIVNGWGFCSGRMVTLEYYGVVGEKAGTVMASESGEFSHSFNIPYSPAGEHRITAANAEGNEAETEFEVVPALTLNLTSGAPGELLTTHGTGFGYKTDTDVYFGVYQVAQVRTDAYGNFDVEFNIPDVKTGTYDVKAQDDDGNTDKASFTTTAGAKMSLTAGSVGSSLTLTGSGFKAGTVTVKYDDVTVTTASADINGIFKATFDIPASRAGQHIVKVTDGEISRSLIFTVESDPPAVPVPVLPADISETQARAYLDWQDVNDPSQPVTYRLQLATDRNFATLALEKDGLTSSEYTLSAAETLAAAGFSSPYYWRVRATDSAGNEGEWSASRSFFVNAPSAPVLLLPAVDVAAGTPIYFKWQSVNSLSSPVTYDIEIAADPNFASVVWQQDGLTDPEYVLAEESNLPEAGSEAPYYWRIRAVDSAGNASEWSAPLTFFTDSSSSLPGWLLYTIIGVVIIAIGVASFRVGRRTAYRDAG